MNTKEEHMSIRQHARRRPAENQGPRKGTSPEPAEKRDQDRLITLKKEMRAFVEDSFMDDESLAHLNRCSPHQQRKNYDYACSDLYGEIDGVVSKCLLGGKPPAEDSEMHEVLVDILDTAFVCAVSIAGPRERFRRSFETNCKRLVDIADSEQRQQSLTQKAGQDHRSKQKPEGPKHAKQGGRSS